MLLIGSERPLEVFAGETEVTSLYCGQSHLEVTVGWREV